eukprot:UN4009
MHTSAHAHAQAHAVERPGEREQKRQCHDLTPMASCCATKLALLGGCQNTHSKGLKTIHASVRSPVSVRLCLYAPNQGARGRQPDSERA